MDKNLMEECIQEVLLDIVMDSKHIREQLLFNEHVAMCSWIKELEYNDIVPVIHELGITDFEGKFSKFLKYGMAALAGGGTAIVAGVSFLSLLGAPAVGAFALYLFRKASDPCNKKCMSLTSPRAEKKICKLDCQIRAIKAILRDIQAQHGKCNKTKNPKACERSLTVQEIKWEKKLQDLMTDWQEAKGELATKATTGEEDNV